MEPHQFASEVFDLLKVSAVGTGGLVATVKLADVSLIVSIGVGIVTFFYVAAKLFYLIRSNGGNSGQ